MTLMREGTMNGAEHFFARRTDDVLNHHLGGTGLNGMKLDEYVQPQTLSDVPAKATVIGPENFRG